MDENKLKILKMLEEGKINSEQAYKLLNAAEDDKLKGKKIVIKVRGPNENVNLAIPLGFMKTMIKFSGKFVNFIPNEAKSRMEEKGIDTSKINEFIESFAESFPDSPQVLIEGKENDEEFYIAIE